LLSLGAEVKKNETKDKKPEPAVAQKKKDDKKADEKKPESS